MKGLQNVVDEERKDWGEQLALLKQTVRALEDLQSARSQIAALSAEIQTLQRQIKDLKDETKKPQKTDEQAAAEADEEKKKGKWRGGVSAALKDIQTNSNVSAMCSIACAVLLLISVGVSCWTWHRVNQSTGNLYNLIQQQPK